MARDFAFPDLASKIARLLVDHIGVHTEHCLTVGRSLLSKGYVILQAVWSLQVQ